MPQGQIPSKEDLQKYLEDTRREISKVEGQSTAAKYAGYLSLAIQALQGAGSIGETLNRSDISDGAKQLIIFGVAGSFAGDDFLKFCVNLQSRTQALTDQVSALALRIGLSTNPEEQALLIDIQQFQLLRYRFPDKIPDYILDATHVQSGIVGSFDVAAHSTPLVLDLDGDGIELTALSGAGAAPVYWDSNNDGFREAMGWVKADDGLLVRDLNNNGIIDSHRELFGSASTDGFAALRALDSNSGTITAADTAFASLKVWRDLNQDGYSQANELFTLAQLNITSINLNATAPNNLSIAGNPIALQSTYTIAGQSRTIVDALLATDLINSVDTRPVTIDTRALFLPQLRGYGTLSDLTIAMSRDGSLLNLVSDFAQKSVSQLFNPAFDLRDAITDIMFRWAGVDTLDPASRGGQFDARKLAFLEKLMGQPFVETFLGGGANPNNFAVIRNLDVAWELAYENIGGRLLLQTEGGRSLLPALLYDLSSDQYVGTFALDQSGLDQLEALGAHIQDKTAFWANVVDFLDTLGLSNADASPLNAAIVASSPSLSLALVRDEVSEKIGIDYTDYRDLITLGGTKYVDQIFAHGTNNILTGGAGDDRLIGSTGTDQLTGGTGDDVMDGSSGSDIFFIARGDGHDQIYDNGPAAEVDAIQFGAGITPADITVRQSSRSIILTFAGGAQDITLVNWLGEDHAVDRVVFANGTVWTFPAIVAASFVATPGDDTLWGNADANVISGGSGSDELHGQSGNDTLDGQDGNDRLYGEDNDDTLTGGAGDDELYGGEGNDRMFGGDGDDVLEDWGGVNTLDGGPGNDRFRLLYDNASGTLDGGTGTNTIIARGKGLAGYTYTNVSILETDGQSIDLTVQQVLSFPTIRAYDRSAQPVTINLTNGGSINLAGIASPGFIIAASTAGNSITGGARDDTILSSAQNETHNGGGGNNTISYANINAAVTVSLATPGPQNTGGGGIDTLSNFQNLTGGSRADRLTGSGGANALDGEGGDDILNGGAGRDILTGGSGNDDFMFDGAALTDARAATPVFDEVTDYGSGDQIDLSALLATAYNRGAGQAVGSLVRAVEENGSSSLLQIDPDGAANGANWVTIARLTNVRAGYMASIILDSALPAGSAITVTALPGSVSIGDATITEGKSGQQFMTFTVTRTGGTAAFAVNYATANGTATTADNDYAAASGTLQFFAYDNTQTFTVAVNGDAKAEPNETFFVNLSGATNSAAIADGQATGTIADDDASTNHAPTLFVFSPDISTAHGRLLSASNFVAASDPDGNAMSYWFRDATPGGGRFEYDGTPMPEGQAFGVSQAQLSHLKFRAAEGGADTIFVNTWDGAASSVVAEIHVNAAANGAPTAFVGSNTTTSHGKVLLASNLFGATDPDADPLSYWFRDNTPGGGRFEYDGVAQAEGQMFGVSAAQLSHLTFRAAENGSDQITAYVSDGIAASNMVDFRVNGTANRAPTVTAGDVSATRGKVLSAASLFAATDLDNDTMSYWFRDGTPGGGQFEYDGVPIAQGQTFGVSQSQLSHLTFRAGSGSTDAVSVYAWDGLAPSSTVTLRINGAADRAPAVAAGDTLAAHGQVLPASSLFLAHDGEGDALSYWFRDSTPGGGQFEYDGVAIAQGQTIGVSGAQLSHLTFRAAQSGSDALSIYASDGVLLGNTVEFHVNVSPNRAPAVTATDTTTTHGKVLSAASLFSATDPDNDAMSYWFRDNTPGGGRFEYDGVPIQQATFGVSQAQLLHLTFRAAQSGADDIAVYASDGTAQSNTASLHVNIGPNHAPTVSAFDRAPFRGQQLAASNLLSASDADGDPLSYYFRDAPGGGHFEYDGTPVAEGQTFGVSQSQLSHLTFRASSGAGNESVFVSVYDGLLSSATIEFHLFT